MNYRIVFCLLCIIASLGTSFSQNTTVTISGIVKDKNEVMPYVNIVLKTAKDSVFVLGGLTDDRGRFSIPSVLPGDYFLEVSFLGYLTQRQQLFVGSLSDFLHLPTIEMEENTELLAEVVVSTQVDAVSDKMEKKIYSLGDNVNQAGGSVLQAMQNLPGVTTQDGKVLLRGSDKVTVMIDGKQTALTGFGNQSGLDNIPASAIDKIELINNPSAKYDANGNGGVINLVLKKNKEAGWNGNLGMIMGIGALGQRKANLPEIRPQYQYTPKINPSLSLNYRNNKINFFAQTDNLYTQTLNKNEFTTRHYSDGTIIRQQIKRNRNTNYFTAKAGVDWNIREHSTLQFSALLGSEKIIDRGDQPFFNQDLSDRLRLWQFVEDELKTTWMLGTAYQHKFAEPGHVLNLGFNYTFHRENEQYFFNNVLPAYQGKDTFKLLSDEHVADWSLDYTRPLKYGKIDGGLKFRYRSIPTNMEFIPGLYAALDTTAGGWANYREIIPALYGNYFFELRKIEFEMGVRLEYVHLQYDVNPEHNTYKSDGYQYVAPFPNVRLAFKINERNKVTAFYNRRVDRPNEVDIRIFPKYDDAEIIKVGNPALRPQFTNSFELGYKKNWDQGYYYQALYHRIVDGTISRISTTVPGSDLIYAVFQNAGKSWQTGTEFVLNQKCLQWYSFNLNMHIYYHQLDAFTVENKYPINMRFSADRQKMFSGNIKWNNTFHFAGKMDAQLSCIYLAPDLIPQGKIAARFSIDVGIKKTIQQGKGAVFVNATDLLNTLVIKRSIEGQNFSYRSADYKETQVFRLGYNYKF